MTSPIAPLSPIIPSPSTSASNNHAPVTSAWGNARSTLPDANSTNVTNAASSIFTGTRNESEGWNAEVKMLPRASLAVAIPEFSKDSQMTEEEYRRLIPLIKFADYTPQPVPYGISLGIKSQPPFNVQWDEETVANKQEELNKIANTLPDSLKADAAVKQICYFLTDVPIPIAPRPATEAKNAAAFQETTEWSVVTETVKLLSEDKELLQREVGLRCDGEALFLSYLLRYISDQIFAYEIPFPQNESSKPYLEKETNTLYLKKLYAIIRSLIEHCDQYLSYNDLCYVLFIHIYMVLTRYDIPDKTAILQIELFNLILDKIKTKKAILDKTKQPNLTELKKQLQFFLTYQQHDALLEKIRKRLDVPKMTAYALLTYFQSDEIGDYSRIEIVRRVLDRYFSGLFSSQGCCVIF